MNEHKKINQDTIAKKALINYGIVRQENQLIEELGELIVAVNHFRRGKAGIDDLIDEIADVGIMLNQISLYYYISDDVKRRREFKMNKLNEKMKRKEM